MNERVRPKASKSFGLLPADVSTAWMRAASQLFASYADATAELPSNDPFAFKARYQNEQFLSKYLTVDADSGERRRQAAIDKWLLVDSRNAKTNVRVQFDECDFGHSTSEELLASARGIVMDIIGEEPPVDLLADGLFTNGASTRVKRSPMAVSEKFVGKADVTAPAVFHFLSILDGRPGWRNLWIQAGNSLNIVPGSVMFTVPKTSEIDRVACKEPEINMYMQRAVGDFIRRRLRKRARINLNDQTINQKLAYRGSLDPGHPEYAPLATIDLSSASDSVSESLVVRLLPPSWFCLLNDIRVKTVSIDGVDHDMSMFSTMGNGFTFELESLLFYALARATMYHTATKGRVSVYGDDLIVPKSAAPRFAKVLQWFGFKLNSKKSFWKGSFRESCGAHWFRGHDVTPFFLRGPLPSVPDLINQLNQLRDWVLRDGDNGLWVPDYIPDKPYLCDAESLWMEFARRVPRSVRGGRDLESSFALVSDDPIRNRYILRTKRIQADQVGGLLQWLHARDRVEDAETSFGVRPRGFVLAANHHQVSRLKAEQLFYHELCPLSSRTPVSTGDVEVDNLSSQVAG